MNRFIQTLLDGLANGAIFASLALALVLVHRATHIPNFAQGELAMVAAYLSWEGDQRLADVITTDLAARNARS